MLRQKVIHLFSITFVHQAAESVVSTGQYRIQERAVEASVISTDDNSLLVTNMYNEQGEESSRLSADTFFLFSSYSGLFPLSPSLP